MSTSTAANGSTSGLRARVCGILLEEHRSLRTVLAVLERLLEDIAQRNTEPDFALLSSALYYIDDFPERVHHPKEDEHIFSRLRRRSALFNDVLDRLQGEHVRSGSLVALIERALVHYQGGAPDGLQRVQSAVSAYCALLKDHMLTEERLLESAGDHLTAEDWAAIAAAFEADADPLSTESTRHEFRLLRARIVAMLPRKIRMAADEHASIEAARR